MIPLTFLILMEDRVRNILKSSFSSKITSIFFLYIINNMNFLNPYEILLNQNLIHESEHKICYYSTFFVVPGANEQHQLCHFKL